jgi:hypothetical protein
VSKKGEFCQLPGATKLLMPFATTFGVWFPIHDYRFSNALKLNRLFDSSNSSDPLLRRRRIRRVWLDEEQPIGRTLLFDAIGMLGASKSDHVIGAGLQVEAVTVKYCQLQLHPVMVAFRKEQLTLAGWDPREGPRVRREAQSNGSPSFRGHCRMVHLRFGST